jgi:5'-3' exonuclease|uniref:Xrn1 N-terminal domain-containing protein n=1 Tax=viral metagenome TaxID=1070528 RepID=A0A6C0B236_9ZZZZ
MGIPFYFASLIRNHSGITRIARELDVDVLGIDFNCLIHRYLQVTDPIKSVLDALDHILKSFRAKKVIIAFDGLVPYAKIVQQRYRRFRVKEAESFDRNQISPDTPYMRLLEEAIRKRFPDVQLSPTQEPGEGEHKIFQDIKKIPEADRKSICIYGLDADLILLSLFNHKLSTELTLLRESGEFNDPSLKQAEFSLLDVQKLILTLPIDIEQYLTLSVLCFGNDFMPSLGIFSLREDGYGRALEYYTKSGKPDLATEEGRATFLDYAAEKEIGVLKELVKSRKQVFERAVVGRAADCISVKYGLHILDGVTNMEPVVDAYWKTFHWTMHYFKTNDVYNWGWVYPYPEAPMIQDIVQLYETTISPGELTYNVTKQLHVILPSHSLRKSKRRVIYPDEHYEETRETWMKKYDWEMKPRISIPWSPISSLTSVCPL